MNHPIPTLRLTPEAAGKLLEQCTKATAELREATRFRKEFDRQLAALIGYQDVEQWIWERICTRFDLDLDLELPASVRHADLVALATEHRDLMPADPAVWDCLIGIEPTAETIRPWSATEARLTFHQRLMDQLAIQHRRKAA